MIIHKGDLIADAPIQELRDATHQANLEDVFRQLTHKEGTAASDMSGIIEKLRS
jgi:ABC-type Na+ transport system ATPase subunit NatA